MGVTVGSALVGRDRELASLRDQVDAVVGGASRIGLIEGEAGIGKTALLSAALAYASDRSLQVLRGGGRDLERDRPFGALAEALGLEPASVDADRATIGRLLRGTPAEADVAESASLMPQLGFRVREAILDLLEREAVHRPIVLAIDDLQWADSSTLLALHEFPRRLAFRPTLLLAVYRRGFKSTDLHRLEDAFLGQGALRLIVPPLTMEAAGRLVRETLHAEPGAQLLQQVARAGGNPLFIKELTGALVEEGVIAIREGRAEIGDVALSPSLRVTILRRIAFLRQETLDLLKVASVLGSSFSLSDLSTALGRRPSDLMLGVEEALRFGVVAEAGDRLNFRHDLVREAIYADMARGVRAALHLQVARALAQAGSPAQDVAAQFALGASSGDTEAVTWLRRAAAEVAPRDPRAAASLLRRSLQLASPAEPDRDAMLARLATSLLWSGQLNEAEAVAHEVLTRDHDAHVGASLRYAVARSFAYQGRLRDSIGQVEGALREPALDLDERARLLGDLSLRLFLLGELDRARRVAHEAKLAAQAADDNHALSTSLSGLSWVAASEGRIPEAVKLATEAVAIGDREWKQTPGSRRSPLIRGGEPVLPVQSRLYLGFTLIDADRFEEAQARLGEGLHLAEELGAVWALSLYHVGLGLKHFHAGAWDDAAAELETSIQLAEDVGSRVWVVLARGIAAHIAIHRADFAAAAEGLKASSRLVDESAALQFGTGWTLSRDALLAEAIGDSARAAEKWEEAWDRCSRTGIIGDLRDFGAHLVGSALRSQEPARARTIAQSLDLLAVRAQTASTRGVALQCRGLVDEDPRALAEAVRVLQNGPRPLAVAAACEDAALLAQRQGRGPDAARFLDESLQVYEQLGADHDSARVRSNLRAVGVRRRRATTRRRAAIGWESLSETELRVAKLAAQGMTNPEIGRRLFISRRTVETHLSHVFGKLGLSSRVELAAQLARELG